MSQPSPTPNKQPHIADLVIDDIRTRKEAGARKYGTALQPFNGRNPLQDAYEESLDQAKYLKQAVIELAALRSELATVKAALATKTSRDVYCPTCKSCGEVGCCPPDKCKHLTCFYGSEYAKSYKELETELANAIRERGAARASLAEARRVIDDLLNASAMVGMEEFTSDYDYIRETKKRAAAFLYKNQPDEREIQQ